MLLLEKILPVQREESPMTACLDVLMLQLTEGRERTLDEYKSILEPHGFSIQQTYCQPEGSYLNFDGILARKVD